MFSKLVDYKKHHVHTVVPTAKNNEYAQLGYWVAKQRMCHKNGVNYLNRVNTLLNSIGFVWLDSQSITDQEKWIKIYNRLIVYKHQHKDTIVPYDYNDGEIIHLGRWVMKQRITNNTNKLLSNRYDLLQSISFVWEDSKSIKEQEQWMEMYQQLVLYKNNHKTARVPWDYQYGNNTHLGQWVYRQNDTITRIINYWMKDIIFLIQLISFGIGKLLIQTTAMTKMTIIIITMIIIPAMMLMMLYRVDQM